MDDLAACGIWPVETVALGTSKRGVLRMTFDRGAVNDLYLPDRGAERILLLVELGRILLDAGTS